MQTARNYVTDITNHTECALKRMPPAMGNVSKLPTNMQELTRYVEALLTPKEQAICDRATD